MLCDGDGGGIGRCQKIEYEASLDRHVSSPDFQIVLMPGRGRRPRAWRFRKGASLAMTLTGLQLVPAGGIKRAAGERNYLGLTVASGRRRSVP